MKRNLLLIFLISFFSCTSAENLFNRAVALQQEGKYGKAAEMLLKIIKDYPDSSITPVALKQLGEIYLFKIGDERNGIEILKKVDTYFPGTTYAVDSLFEAGDYLFEKGKYEEVIPLMKHLLQYNLKPDLKRKVIMDLLYSYLFTNDREDFKREAENYIPELNNSPLRWKIMLLLSDIYFESGEEKKGEEILNELTETAPERFKTEAKYSLANHYIAAGRYRKALVIFYQLTDNPKWKEKVSKKIEMLKKIIYNKQRYR